MSNNKLGPKTKNVGASNNNLANGTTNTISIRNYFKPVLGKAAAENN